MLSPYERENIIFYIMWAQLHFVKSVNGDYTSYCLLEKIGEDFQLPHDWNK